MLRRKLASQRDLDGPPPPRVLFFGLRPPLTQPRSVLAEELQVCSDGMHVALRLADGCVVVGDVLRNHLASLVVRPWGCARARRIAKAAVVTLAVVGPHSHAARSVVAERQRQGLSALPEKTKA